MKGKRYYLIGLSNIARAKMALYIIGILASLYLIDHIGTNVYCKIQVKKDNKYGILMKDKPQYTYEQVENFRFPKKQIKAIFHLYKGWIRYKLNVLGRIPCHAYRKWVLQHIYLMHIGKRVVIYGGFEIRAPWKIEIGEGTIIGDECKLDGRNGLKIGKNVNFSTGAWIWTEQHDLNDPMFASNDSGGPVCIGDRAWISSRSVILPNTTIGEGAVVAANALVTKQVPPYSVVGGGTCADYWNEKS